MATEVEDTLTKLVKAWEREDLDSYREKWDELLDLLDEGGEMPLKFKTKESVYVYQPTTEVRYHLQDELLGFLINGRKMVRKYLNGKTVKEWRVEGGK